MNPDPAKTDALLPGLDRNIPLATLLTDKERRDHLKVLSYRPGRRLVLLDTGGQKNLVLKGFRKRKMHEIVRRYKTAQAAFTGQHIRVPKIINTDEQLACLIMAHVSGEPLALSAAAKDGFNRLGQSLRNFQDCMTTADVKNFNSRDELGVIDKFSNKLSCAGLDPPEQWSALRKRLQSRQAALPTAEMGLCHRDLHDKQFIQHGNNITLLDFDLMCRADVALDPANFLAHLDLRRLQDVRGATRESIEVCGKHFLQGLNRHAEPGFRERHCFYRATSFCRLALVYTLRPSWRSLVPDLVSMGHRCVDELQRSENG